MHSVAAHAQMNLPNPLIQPVKRPVQGDLPAPARGERGQLAMPPLPSEFRQGSSPSVLAGTAPLKDPADIARAQLSGYSVSAIFGKVAVLRRPFSSSSSTAITSGQFTIPQPGVATNTGNSAAARFESLTVRDGAPFSLPGVDGVLSARVTGDSVTIYSGDRKGSQVAYLGEIEGTAPATRTITLQVKDADYRQALNVKAESSSASSSSTSSPSKESSDNNR